MKKIIMFLSCIFLVVGCKKTDGIDLIKDLDKKVKDSKNYQITARLEIFRNEEKFMYDVISTYKQGDFFRVELVNKSNNHKQIILKDKESVYVLTPSLNKSFKFQSEWPYNNSQIYLLQPIINDVMNDKNRTFESEDDEYIVTSKVNYSSEKQFKTQKIYFDSEKIIKKVEVLDDNNTVKMCLEIINIEYNIKLDDNYFDIKNYVENNQSQENYNEKESAKNNKIEEKTSAHLNEIVYPMYVPTETYLSAQDVVTTESGERVILTFIGDSQFTLIQENLDTNEEIGYVYGDPYIVMDTIGAITDYSVSWISNGKEYSVMSETMSVDEMLMVAQSIKVEAVGK